MSEKEDDTQSMTLTFTRPPVEAGKSIRDVVTLIGRVGDNQDLQYKIIKRFVHSEKLSAYSRVYLNISNDKFAKDFARIKMDTHRDLYDELNKEVMRELRNI